MMLSGHPVVARLSYLGKMYKISWAATCYFDAAFIGLSKAMMCPIMLSNVWKLSKGLVVPG